MTRSRRAHAHALACTHCAQILLEAADWMSKKEKGFVAEVTAADKSKEIPVKKK